MPTPFEDMVQALGRAQREDERRLAAASAEAEAALRAQLMRERGASFNPLQSFAGILAVILRGPLWEPHRLQVLDAATGRNLPPVSRAEVLIRADGSRTRVRLFPRVELDLRLSRRDLEQQEIYPTMVEVELAPDPQGPVMFYDPPAPPPAPEPKKAGAECKRCGGTGRVRSNLP